MRAQIPRIMTAAVSSGSGKTTVTCALLMALKDRGRKPTSCKCGPDYIDTMFHSGVIGAPSTNLDLYFFDDSTVKYLLAENAIRGDITVIEGVMGYYDGLGIDSTEASSYEAAMLTQTPVILVLNSRGAALSVLAAIKGFREYRPNSNIKGVILNNCTAYVYEILKKEIIREFGGEVLPLGYMPVMKDCTFESRHLGLVTAGEIEDLEMKLERLKEQALVSLDIDGIIRLSEEAPTLEFEKPAIRPLKSGVRIGVARDRAFCFYYEDSLRLLEEMGAELVNFSPMNDGEIPDDLDGLYLGGGYPELYKEILSGNTSMRESVKRAFNNGIPTVAECGGFMYLTESIGGCRMVGVLPGSCSDRSRLMRFGYVRIKSKKDNMLFKAGQEAAAHEFHHWDCTDNGTDFIASKRNGRSWEAIYADDHTYAGFPHFHFCTDPKLAENFLAACLKYRKERIK